MAEEASNSENELVITSDGSHTVYSSRFNQHYHNPNGAVAESRYVFFEKNGLIDAISERDHITILEVGFGTGLNLLLLMDYCLAQDSAPSIDYYSVEGFPLSADTATELNYKEYLHHPEITSHLTTIFSNLSKGINHFNLTKNIALHLFNGMFKDFPPENISANYIFHDAFSPDTNPDLWTGKVFKKLKQFCANDAVLSTYSAASKAQGALAWAGWNVAKTRGALGKREMMLASLDSTQLSNFKRINEKRYARRYEEEDFN